MLYDIGEPGVPEPEEWLIEELGVRNSVGADPNLLSYGMN